MRIKNTDILLKRAIEHKEQDHITQRTYGDIHYIANGDVEVTKWKGCAISCLATEATITGLKKQEDFDFDKYVRFIQEVDSEHSIYTIDIEAGRLRSMLADTFGMCDKLIYIAECIFEGSNVDYATDWPVKFANAIRAAEGVNIYDKDIEDFWDHAIIYHFSPADYEYFPVEFGPDSYEDDEWGLWTIDEYFDFCTEDVGELFIEFIESVINNRKSEQNQLSLV